MWMMLTLATSLMYLTLASPTTAQVLLMPHTEKDRTTLPLTILLPTTLHPTTRLHRTTVPPPLPMPQFTTPSSKLIERPRLMNIY